MARLPLLSGIGIAFGLALIVLGLLGYFTVVSCTPRPALTRLCENSAEYDGLAELVGGAFVLAGGFALSARLKERHQTAQV